MEEARSQRNRRARGLATMTAIYYRRLRPSCKPQHRHCRRSGNAAGVTNLWSALSVICGCWGAHACVDVAGARQDGTEQKRVVGRVRMRSATTNECEMSRVR